MKAVSRSVAGTSVALLGISPFFLLTLNTTFHASPLTVGERVRLCVQQRRDAGYFDDDVTREERRAIRMQFRLCIHQAIAAMFDHRSSSSQSSMSSSVSSQSSMPSSSSSSLSSSSRSSSSLSSTSSSSSSLSSSSSTGSLSSSSQSSSSLSSSSSSVSSSASSSSSSSVSSSASSSSSVTVQDVRIEHHAFSPASITVRKGTTVRWTNHDNDHHTVTGTTAGGPHSGVLYEDDSYSFTFTKTGTFPYRCLFHYQTMQGWVTVIE